MGSEYMIVWLVASTSPRNIAIFWYRMLLLKQWFKFFLHGLWALARLPTPHTLSKSSWRDVKWIRLSLIESKLILHFCSRYTSAHYQLLHHSTEMSHSTKTKSLSPVKNIPRSNGPITRRKLANYLGIQYTNTCVLRHSGV